MPIIGWIALGALAASSGFGASASSEVPVRARYHTVKEQRGVFNLVQLQAGRATACHGQPPIAYRSRHTGRDVAAAIVTVGLWTPTHLDVICPATPPVRR